MHDKLPRDKVVVVETGAVENSVFVRISDQGPGISADVAQQLFTPFFTTKPEGLGLGLNICRTIVESHQGRLVFNNRPDGGAAFTVYLPVHA
jgi:two-component system sensor histidine kinase DctS